MGLFLFYSGFYTISSSICLRFLVMDFFSFFSLVFLWRCFDFIFSYGFLFYFFLFRSAASGLSIMSTYFWRFEDS